MIRILRILLYIVIIGLSFLAPLERADVARLQPIEAVALLKTDDQIMITTDTGDQGAGQNAEDALNDLIMNTPGIVYLDTAKYLLVSESAIDEIESLRNDLKESVKLCLWNGEGDLKDAVKYLSVHGDLPQMRKWEKGMNLPVYICKK